MILRTCNIIINDSLKSDAYIHQINRFKEELENKNIKVRILKNYEIVSILNNGIKSSLPECDFIIYLDKDKYLLTILENLNYKIFNYPDAILKCDDKFITYMSLKDQDIKMIKTTPGFLTYDKNYIIKKEYIEILKQHYKFPFIIKTSHGSQGTGVFLINNDNDLLSTLNNLKLIPYVVQEYEDCESGSDIRVIVINNKVIGAIKRENMSSHTSNVFLGGKSSIYKVDDKLEKLSLIISKTLNTFYCGLDFLVNKEGEYILCEANSNAFFMSFENTTKINVAKTYIEELLKQL